jgi:nucleotide-binding universal stress UspA family protein
MGYQKIVVGLDRDTHSQSPIFETALELAVRDNARLMLFHGLPAETTAGFMDRVAASAALDQSGDLRALDRLHQSEAAHIRAWLDGLCQVCTLQGIQISSTAEYGPVGPALVQLAKGWGADLIVIGLTKRSTLGDLLVGSVTNHVIHHAPCSILLVHEQAAGA